MATSWSCVRLTTLSLDIDPDFSATVNFDGVLMVALLLLPPRGDRLRDGVKTKSRSPAGPKVFLGRQR